MTSAAKSSAAKQAAEFTRIYRLPPPEKIAALRRGVSASQVGILSAIMHISKDTLTSTLGLSRATVSRKVLSDQTLSQDESERVLGVQALIGQVQAWSRSPAIPQVSMPRDGWPAGKMRRCPHWAAARRPATWIR